MLLKRLVHNLWLFAVSPEGATKGLFYEKNNRYQDRLKDSLKPKGKLYLLDLSTVEEMIVVYHHFDKLKYNSA